MVKFSFISVVMCDAVVLARHICYYITFFSLILGKAYTLWPLDPASRYNHVVCWVPIQWNIFSRNWPVIFIKMYALSASKTFLTLKSRLSIFMFATVKITIIIHWNCHTISISRYVVKGYLLLAIITPCYYFHFILSNQFYFRLRTSQLSFTNLDSVFESDKPLKVISTQDESW